MNVVKFIEKLPLIRWLVKMAKTYSFPGFKKVPIYNVIRFISKEIQKDDIITRANSIAFSIFLSLFPTIIFFFTILPLIPATSDILPLIDTSLENFLPMDAHKYLFGMIYDILAIKREGLLSIGFFLALYFASSGMKTLMRGFDKSDYKQTFRRRGFLKYQLVSVALTMLLALTLILSVVLIVLGKQILGTLFSALELGQLSSDIFKILRWLIVGVSFYLIISVIYKYGPSMRRRTSIFNVGAYLASILIILSSIGFSYFVNNFGKYNELYGSIGALIVLLIWLQIVALILLIGFELNASIAVNRDLSMKEDQQEELTLK